VDLPQAAPLGCSEGAGASERKERQRGKHTSGRQRTAKAHGREPSLLRFHCDCIVCADSLRLSATPCCCTQSFRQTPRRLIENKTPAKLIVQKCVFCLQKKGAVSAQRDSPHVKLHWAECRSGADVSKSRMRFTRVEDRSGLCGTKPKVPLRLIKWEALFRETRWCGKIRGQPVTLQQHTPSTPIEPGDAEELVRLREVLLPCFPRRRSRVHLFGQKRRCGCQSHDLSLAGVGQRQVL